MPVLAPQLRNKLEKTIIDARDIAEEGARAALQSLAVHHYEPYAHMSPKERQLRNHLRARARQLGDKQDRRGKLEITHLARECAYEHWHRMLFARFLAENDLLIEPDMGVAISLEECQELAKEEGKDLWTLASEFAQRMLPQIFRPDDPLLKITFAREHQLKLERLLDDLEPDVFTTSDSLGWGYQFWQTKRKKEVNKSGGKIGADELPAVTQLFTEPYMVNFLLHNTLGAWWAGKVLNDKPYLADQAESEEDLRQALALPGVSWDYLRFIRKNDGKNSWEPAAGIFDSWPKMSAELKIFDPCCGSGHFLVEVLYHLVPLVMAEEGISASDAVDAVLQNNLHGLEIDERCTQISAFALALAAWTYPDAEGYRSLPRMRISCSGVAPNTNKDNWLTLAGDDVGLQKGMARLYELFQDAPTIGSLINPDSALDEPLFQASFENLRRLFEGTILEETLEYEQHEMGISASGITEAVQILGGSYHLLITNVPYLARAKQAPKLQTYIEKNHERAKQDLATAFVERCISACAPGGSIALVTPQNWLFLGSYKKLRVELLNSTEWNVVARLGENGFESPQAAGAFTVLLSLTRSTPKANNRFMGIDATVPRNPKEKAVILRGELNTFSTQKDAPMKDSLRTFLQKEQLSNPDARVTYYTKGVTNELREFADSYQGIVTGDIERFTKCFWEVCCSEDIWVPFRRSNTMESTYGDVSTALRWEEGKGSLHKYASLARDQLHDMHESGNRAWGRLGVAVNRMRDLKSVPYYGEHFDNNVAVIVPKNERFLSAIMAFTESSSFANAIRNIDQTIKVTNKTLLKVPFDLQYWQSVAEEKHPQGLPEPHSNNPTQWLFKGAVAVSKVPLQVAVARLLGYRWPGQDKDKSATIEHQIGSFVANDGVVCLTSVRGEESASERLRSLLTAVYGGDWTPAKETELIALTGSKANNLDEWLRNDFSEHHCKLFLHRPFIWHIWDGRRRDGFHALLNYHKLAEGNGKGRQLLENLTYSYLGDWITRQKDGVTQGEGGAEDRLAAALELQKRLIAILAGEPHFDIFVRWKPIEEQPIGWEPDINDGVRINIRPFMALDIPGGRKGAGILRWKPNIHWNKDRGKEPYRPEEQYPWFWKNDEFTGDRVNNIHLINEEKRKARERAKDR